MIYPNYVPASKRVENADSGQIWVRFSPQDATIACQNLYADNETVQGFFPWDINYDTVLQWLIDSGCKTEEEVTQDSTSWGNYSDDAFSLDADGKTTGMFGKPKPTTSMIWRETTGSGRRRDMVPVTTSCAADTI